MRIVSLVPSVTSILCALGARNELVGVSKWCSAVADVKKLPKVGDCWSIDIAAVMKLKPTLLIGSVPFKLETVGKILEQPVAFLALNPRSLADIDSNIQVIGNLTGRARAAEKLIQKMHRSFERVARATRRTDSRPRVYCEAWPNPRISSPPWVGELVEIAGGKMVLPWGARVNDEEVAAARPDVIVLAWTATRNRANRRQVFQNAAWKEVPAVRTRRVHVISDELLNTPGPPLMEGASGLLRVIHPELVR